MQNNDPQTIWQNQNIEGIKVPLEYFRQRAEQQRSSNIRAVVATYVVYLGIAVITGIISLKTPNLTLRIGWVLLTIGLLYAIVQTHQRLLPRPPASDGVLSAPDRTLSISVGRTTTRLVARHRLPCRSARPADCR